MTDEFLVNLEKLLEEEAEENLCPECTIQGLPDEDMHIKADGSELCYRCCATSGTGCQICQTKYNNETIFRLVLNHRDLGIGYVRFSRQALRKILAGEVVEKTIYTDPHLLSVKAVPVNPWER